jgi:hypothetical protein
LGVKYIDPEGKRAFEPEYPKLVGPVGEIEPVVSDATAHVLKVGQPNLLGGADPSHCLARFKFLANLFD